MPLSIILAFSKWRKFMLRAISHNDLFANRKIKLFESLKHIFAFYYNFKNMKFCADTNIYKTQARSFSYILYLTRVKRLYDSIYAVVITNRIKLTRLGYK